jgi:hypothetical protein
MTTDRGGMGERSRPEYEMDMPACGGM